jgi:hypothetical protein
LGASLRDDLWDAAHKNNINHGERKLPGKNIRKAIKNKLSAAKGVYKLIRVKRGRRWGVVGDSIIISEIWVHYRYRYCAVFSTCVNFRNSRTFWSFEPDIGQYL